MSWQGKKKKIESKDATSELGAILEADVNFQEEEEEEEEEAVWLREAGPL